MKRDLMRDWLASLDPADRYPLWIISYNRPGTAPMLDRAATWSSAGDVNVLVRTSQADAYRKAYPALNVVAMPDVTIPNCGSARWTAAQLAYADGSPTALLFDDDVLSMNFLWQGVTSRGKNVGAEKSAPSTKEDLAVLPDLEERLLAAMSSVAEDVFAAHPRAVLGGAIKRHMSFDAKNHRNKYILNGGVTPRQAMVYHMDRMAQMDIRMNLEAFGVHGEDIGMNAEVLAAGGDCFAMPSFIYDHWPEEINIHKSSIRNAENAARLHAEEWDALQQYPIRDYLRVKRSIVDGSYEWGDVDWVKLGKLRGQPSQRFQWDEPALAEFLYL